MHKLIEEQGHRYSYLISRRIYVASRAAVYKTHPQMQLGLPIFMSHTHMCAHPQGCAITEFLKLGLSISVRPTQLFFYTLETEPNVHVEQG